jgi:hypothetical protein
MTPARSAKSLIDQADKTGKRIRVVHVPMGHHQMNESPEETLGALKQFFGISA